MNIFSKPKFLMLLISLIVLTSCGTQRIAPITGRKYRVQENSFSDVQMLNLVKSDYSSYVASLGGDSSNKRDAQKVREVASRLINAAVNYLQSNGYENELQYYEWEVHLVPAPGQVNATCMPGGKIVVFEGILPVADNEAGLAAILGHEIGHAIAHHVAEKFTKINNKKIWQTLTAAGLSITGTVLGGDAESVNDLAKNTIGLSNQIMEFVEMKYSRSHEYEADHIGMVLMAMAGYDPHEAPKVWERMTQQYGDNQMRILSTHPSNKNRMKKMNEKWMEEAMAYYDKYINGRGNLSISQSTSSYSGSSKYSHTNQSGEAEQYKVTATSLNIRSIPSLSNSRILGKLTKGECPSVIEIKNGWAKISYKGKTGYVKFQYLQKIR